MHSFTSSLSFLLLASLLALVGNCASAVAADLAPGGELAARAPGHIATSWHRRRGSAAQARRASTDFMLYPGRRAAGASFTFFKTGLGACGGTNVASDFIVALDMQQFDVDSHCGAAITITINGKTAHATIADRCVGCGYNNLDLTEGLFAFFDPSMGGELYGEWEFGSGAAPTTTSAKPTPTPMPMPTPTPTPKTTSSKRTSTTSSWTTSSVVTSSTAISTTSASATTSATSAAASVAPTLAVVPGNIEASFEAFLGMSSIFMSALGASN